MMHCGRRSGLTLLQVCEIVKVYYSYMLQDTGSWGLVVQIEM